MLSVPKPGGLRLDQFLRTRFTYRSRNEWQEAIRRGELKINGREIRASKILRTGDKLSFNPGKIKEPEVNADWSLIHESDGIWSSTNRDSSRHTLPGVSSNIHYGISSVKNTGNFIS